MRTLDDDMTLMAYADGELDQEAAANIEAGARRNPAVQRRLEAFQVSRALLHTAYNGPLHEPIPEALLSAVSAAEPAFGGADSLRASNVVRLPQSRGRSAIVGWATAAAVAALAIGFGGGQYWESEIGLQALHQSELASAMAARDQVVGLALETLPNGRSVPWTAHGGVGGVIMPVETYLNADGTYCRSYVVSLTRDGVTDERQEIACRHGVGDWRPEGAPPDADGA